MDDTVTPQFISGKIISPGLAEGKTFVHRDILPHVDTPLVIGQGEIDDELENLEDATASITSDLLVLSDRVEKEMDAQLGAIFEAHNIMLNDPYLQQELRIEIRQNLLSASSAVKVVFLRWEKRFLNLQSQVAKHKGDDMRDLSNRLSAVLSGISAHPLEQMPFGSVLVAERLLPSDIIYLSKHSTAAVLLERGGAGSHAALFAREMGLPCISDLSGVTQRVPAEVHALVDANSGDVIFQPNSPLICRFREKVKAQKRIFQLALKKARKVAVTNDGVSIAVYANVGSREDTKTAVANGAEGVGLYRTERVYLGRTTPPDENELMEEMRSTLEPAINEPVCVRLLDIGADKPLPFIGFLAESNPALGRRGIRMLREYPHLLETQLRALLHLSKDFDLSILVPMVTVPEDMIVVRKTMKKLGSELGIINLPKLGAMIETPAAVLSVKALEAHADFFSIGTNDLTQYTFAVDRENVSVEPYFLDSSQVIFQLLGLVLEGVSQAPLSICGELAGRPSHVSQILQCGIRSFSIAPPLIPMIKETIRQSVCVVPL